MSKKPYVYLSDIRREVEFLVESCKGMTRREFDDDPVLQRAVVRSLEIIGEATKNLPDEFRNKHEAIA